MNKAVLLLEDGTYYIGRSSGVKGEVTGEIVFNTGMAGYQEILTDPSYTGQMVVLTYPLIGNYGICHEDNQADRVAATAMIVKDLKHHYGNWRADEEIESFLIKNKIVCLKDIDTRSLVLHLRQKGSMKAIISTIDDDIQSLRNKLNEQPGIVGLDLVREVSTPHIYRYDVQIDRSYVDFPFICEENKVKCVAVYDFGIKNNILNYLRCIAQKVIVFPAHTPIKEMLEYDPSGVFLSNGPGDPAAVKYAITNAKKLLLDHPDMPVFGVCLGHQIIGLALEGKSYKLKFGHHGVNQPVKNLLNGKVEITSQNHCFSLDESTIKDKVKTTHVNLNDNTLEGMQMTGRPVFSIQYHPEAGPGPRDSNYLFEKFYKIMIKS